jgi:drug/metabolite transporter (DMT)-like permease
VDVVFGLLSAAANTAGAILSKGLAIRYPARQLIGPLFALNCLLLLPLAPFVEWTWSPTIVVFHAISGALLCITALAIWDLYDHGSAAATVTAQSISPLPTALAVAILLPGTLEWAQVVAAIIVVAAVLIGLADSFGTLGRRRSAGTVLVASVGTGLVTVMGRLLADEGAGVIETYVVRTAIAAVVCTLLIPPRDVPLRAMPAMIPRAAFITAHFVLILIGVQDGNPAVVQTAVATAPLLSIGVDVARLRRRPSARLVVAAVLAVAGVAAILLSG